MTNDFRKNKSGGLTVAAAIISAFVLAVAGLASALALTLKKRSEPAPDTANIAEYLLVDASASLMSSLSAMRLCNEAETARELSSTALVFAVRAETALECEYGNWSDCRCKEAFLNDVATILHSTDPLDIVARAEEMYEYSAKLYSHVSTGTAFDYNGELMGGDGSNGGEVDETPAEKPSEEDIARDGELLFDALGATVKDYIGTYNGRNEFDLERDGKPGYAMTENGKIYEFSFAHSGGDGETVLEESEAVRIASECAEKCGFDGLEVYSVDIKNDYALVLLCRDVDGAMCRDECAACAVVGDTAVAFSATKCDKPHKLPKVKVSEEQARKNAPNAQSEGRLVTRRVGGRDRVCYEYRYELEDGVHYVYVCAENGKQMQIN